MLLFIAIVGRLFTSCVLFFVSLLASLDYCLEGKKKREKFHGSCFHLCGASFLFFFFLFLFSFSFHSRCHRFDRFARHSDTPTDPSPSPLRLPTSFLFESPSRSTLSCLGRLDFELRRVVSMITDSLLVFFCPSLYLVLQRVAEFEGFHFGGRGPSAWLFLSFTRFFFWVLLGLT